MSCKSSDGKNVAVKIIKNKPAYFRQAMLEIGVLKMLNHGFDADDEQCIVRMLDYFVYRRHVCIVFEELHCNLYELLKHHKFKGLSLEFIQNITEQLVTALQCLQDANIIHCDLKPENVMLCNGHDSKIKLIDFGGAAFEGQLNMFTYIQSRFYRAPEVLLRVPPPFTGAIDVWSLGCVCAELFLGLPIFPGRSSYDQIRCIVKVLGVPDLSSLEMGAASEKFFSRCGDSCKLRVLDQDPPAKHLNFNFHSVEEMVKEAPRRCKWEDRLHHKSFSTFLEATLVLDPERRAAPMQLSSLPFLMKGSDELAFQPGTGEGRSLSQSIWKNRDVLQTVPGVSADDDTPSLQEKMVSFCLDSKPLPRHADLDVEHRDDLNTHEDEKEVEEEEEDEEEKELSCVPQRMKWRHLLEIANLVEMGFSSDESNACLSKHDGNFMAALHELVNGKKESEGLASASLKQVVLLEAQDAMKVGTLLEEGFELGTTIKALSDHRLEVNAARQAMRSADAEAPVEEDSESYRPQVPLNLGRSQSYPAGYHAPRQIA
eukprot:TRINITY_DN112184_c0_g1_i1.p1 TRINITY_DN112184_c0_g1~~TRINITY_DN112184_c0_g1_i1.p1  ORF type:complete len:600 (-),score=100.77 TRINITY_DN112184_c0_g1_i1:34-1659(-)